DRGGELHNGPLSSVKALSGQIATHPIFCLDICHGICQSHTMADRHVKLFKNGRNQAVRIPREFELPGEDAIIRKDGQRLIIEPAPPQSLLAVLATLPTTLDDEFPPIEDLPTAPIDL